MMVVMQKNIFCKLFFILFLFTTISLSIAIPKKKSWRDWFNEPIYVEIPVLEGLHENICSTLEIDDLYKWIALLPDGTYKVVARTAGQGLSVQRKIKIISDPVARQLIDPLLDLLRKGYWVRTIAKEAVAASWQTNSWAKMITLYGCDLTYTTIAYPRDKVAWRFIKSLLLSDWYMKLYKGVVPAYVQNKQWLDFVVNAYVLAASNYLLSILKFDKSC
ncbi:MAG TPA: hypothetical protein ENI08_01560 [Candidatus Dependentiae bacterium]|nr:hypothetical protein [Candidatus Dependentiae bacterium]